MKIHHECIDRIYTGVVLSDLNLLRTFVLLHETRSVTRTAERLSVTQPSVSHALARLRRDLNDQLFSRSPRGLRSTHRADELYPHLKDALDAIDATLDGTTGFDQSTSRRAFRLLWTDLGEVSLLPPLLERICVEAPGVSLRVDPLDMGRVEDELRQGHADAIICIPRITSPDIERTMLFDDVYCGIRATDHPRLREDPTLEEFCAERHITVDAAAGHTDVDEALARVGATRDAALRISHFAALPQLVESCDCLAIIPSTVARQFRQVARVTPFALPLDVPPVQVSCYTYRRRIPDPGIQWLRQTVLEVLRDWSS
ncbi:LysR family transcriptional regulator [Janibacter sp. Soil728]|uniref:LysR family transcriptional regulator n=1 Tax=Janibacter sp. Soil728 TaxID=1736393 RepID=UPI0006FA6A8F|nr:LysR family transcriptional regulator [Janibacter sp. Soil728]KRE35967.1 LysR family transcriptional regulator [Janibacter sp. Soil728]